MIQKLRSAPAPVKSSSVGVAVKKLAARASGYVGSSAFEGARGSGKAVGVVPQSDREVRRANARDFKQIHGALKKGSDAVVRNGVGQIAARLGLKLPDLSGLSGWHAVGALGSALGHAVGDVFSHGDLRHVIHRASMCARSRPINDPDPSNGHVV